MSDTPSHRPTTGSRKSNIINCLPAERTPTPFKATWHTLRTGSYTAIAHPGFSADFICELLRDPAAPLSAPTSQIVKEGDTTCVARVEWSFNGTPTQIAYKCVRRLTWLKRFTQRVGPNRTWNSFRAASQLDELRIPTATALVILKPDRRRADLPTWIANAWVEGGVELANLPAIHALQLTQGQIADLVRNLGTYLGRLHYHNGTHRDLKPHNILIRRVDPTSEPELCLIDLDGLQFRRWISAARRWRDLSRLAVGVHEAGGLSQTLHLRFLKSYLDELCGSSRNWKPAWRALTRANDVRVRQRQRRATR